MRNHLNFPSSTPDVIRCAAVRSSMENGLEELGASRGGEACEGSTAIPHDRNEKWLGLGLEADPRDSP